MRFRRLVILAAIGAASIMVVPTAQAASGSVSFSGTVEGCKYTVSFNTDAETFSAGTTNCGSSTAAITATLSGSYKDNYVKLGSASGSATIDGHSVSFNQDIGWGFSVPVGSDYTLETLLAAIAAGTQNQQAAQAAIDAVLEKAVEELGEVALEQLFGASGPLSSLLGAQKSYCSSASSADPFCDGSDPVTSDSDSGSVSTDDDQQALCPAVNSLQSQFVFVCVPSFIAGDLDTGSKPLVLLPGAALIVLPIGGDSPLDLSTTPTISSSKAIVSLGGVIVGYNAKLSAPDLALAAGAVDFANALTLSGDNVNAGTVNLDEATGALPGDVLDNQYYKAFQATAKAVNLPNPIPSTGSFSTPLEVAAASIDVEPAKSFSLGSSSTLDTSGRGGAGGTPAYATGGLPGGEAPGGAMDGYGGSHGGYGGTVEQIWDSQGWGTWQGMDGRGPTFDSPFAPSAPGSGGSGNYRDSVDYGGTGGGVVRINGPKAAVQIGGTIDSSGQDEGACPGDCNPYAPEAAGAGGTIYLTGKSLAGGGALDADGGGYPAGWNNSDGGAGGGGRIALIYGDESGWQGTAHAHGGADHNFQGLTGDEEFFSGTGGAGTLFTRQVTFNDDGSVKAGAGDFTDGTLTIDGGHAPGFYPPPDGTPIDDAWGSPNRRLVLTGEARGYGTSPDFGEIDVLDGSDLTGMIGAQTLSVTAGTLKVDATSRIDMSGRGYAGGPDDFTYGDPNGGAAGTAPGQTPSLDQAGGSHGGAGGSEWGGGCCEVPSQAGSTYDDPQHPSLPGGGGAGGFDTETGNRAVVCSTSPRVSCSWTARCRRTDRTATAPPRPTRRCSPTTAARARAAACSYGRPNSPAPAWCGPMAAGPACWPAAPGCCRAAPTARAETAVPGVVAALPCTPIHAGGRARSRRWVASTRRCRRRATRSRPPGRTAARTRPTPGGRAGAVAPRPVAVAAARAMAPAPAARPRHPAPLPLAPVRVRVRARAGRARGSPARPSTRAGEAPRSGSRRSATRADSGARWSNHRRVRARRRRSLASVPAGHRRPTSTSRTAPTRSTSGRATPPAPIRPPRPGGSGCETHHARRRAGGHPRALPRARGIRREHGHRDALRRSRGRGQLPE